MQSGSMALAASAALVSGGQGAAGALQGAERYW